MTHEIVPRRSDSYSMTPFDFFEDFGRSFFDGFPSNLIKTDIHENDNEFLVDENGVLTITGQHQTDHATEDEKGRLVRSERSLTSVRRQYLLENVKEDEIKASYAEGILKLTLPKDQGKQASKKLIPIE